MFVSPESPTITWLIKLGVRLVDVVFSIFYRCAMDDAINRPREIGGSLIAVSHPANKSRFGTRYFNKPLKRLLRAIGQRSGLKTWN